MKQEIDTLLQETLERVANIDDVEELERLRIHVLGRKGEIARLFKKLGKSPAQERPALGRILNEARARLESAIKEATSRTSSVRLDVSALDTSLPGRLPYFGHLHPITQVGMEITAIFQRLGFEVVEGPDVESDYYNFEALNIPKDHPARDMQDTFYVTDNIVLRTHTSPIQVRVMEKQPPPVRIIAPGKAYRCDSDVTHTPMFHQVEGQRDVFIPHVPPS